MKKIKIIRGTYGLICANGTVKPVGVNDAPFTLPDEKADRLLAIGVAELIEEIEESSLAARPVPEKKATTVKKAPTKKKNEAPKIDAAEVMP